MGILVASDSKNLTSKQEVAVLLRVIKVSKFVTLIEVLEGKGVSSKLLKRRLGFSKWNA